MHIHTHILMSSGGGREGDVKVYGIAESMELDVLTPASQEGHGDIYPPAVEGR